MGFSTNGSGVCGRFEPLGPAASAVSSARKGLSGESRSGNKPGFFDRVAGEANAGTGGGVVRLRFARTFLMTYVRGCRRDGGGDASPVCWRRNKCGAGGGDDDGDRERERERALPLVTRGLFELPSPFDAATDVPIQNASSCASLSSSAIASRVLRFLFPRMSAPCASYLLVESRSSPSGTGSSSPGSSSSSESVTRDRARLRLCVVRGGVGNGTSDEALFTGLALPFGAGFELEG